MYTMVHKFEVSKIKKIKKNKEKYVQQDCIYLKLQSITFLVKNDPKSKFEQEHNQPVFNTIALL